MSELQVNNIQPISGQALTIKDEGGTASITVQTDGDLTLSENAYLGSSKGIYFDGQTTSANFLDDYEEGTWSPAFNGTSSGAVGKYIKIGNLVYFKADATNGNASATSTITGLPFAPVSPHGVWRCGWASDDGVHGGYVDNTHTQLQSTDTGSNTAVTIGSNTRILLAGFFTTS